MGFGCGKADQHASRHQQGEDLKPSKKHGEHVKSISFNIVTAGRAEDSGPFNVSAGGAGTMSGMRSGIEERNRKVDASEEEDDD
jgi:hypothetical protein